MRYIELFDVYELITISMVSVGIVLLVSIALYWALKSRHIRETSVYLSGEPEGVVSEITPGVGALYWGFVRKFAKRTYQALLEKIHTGSLQDWLRFISSWFGLLILLSIVFGVIMIVLR